MEACCFEAPTCWGSQGCYLCPLRPCLVAPRGITQDEISVSGAGASGLGHAVAPGPQARPPPGVSAGRQEVKGMKQRAVQRLLCGHTALPAPVLLPSLLLAHEPQQRLAITFPLSALSPVPGSTRASGTACSCGRTWCQHTGEPLIPGAPPGRPVWMCAADEGETGSPPRSPSLGPAQNPGPLPAPAASTCF